jgi:hypothetical protein
MKDRDVFSMPDIIKRIALNGDDAVLVVEDGKLILPANTVVTTKDGTTLSLTDGGIVTSDGIIAATGEVTVTDKKGTTTIKSSQTRT